MFCDRKTLYHYLSCERFALHTEHSRLHCIFAISEPSIRLVSLTLQLAEFNFEVRYIYKKLKYNQQFDEISRIRTNVETIYNNDDEDIPALILDDTNGM